MCGVRILNGTAAAVLVLAAAGIAGFRDMLHYSEAAAPLRRLVTTEDVGNTALYLCSDAASQITGANLSIDGGWTAE